MNDKPQWQALETTELEVYPHPTGKWAYRWSHDRETKFKCALDAVKHAQDEGWLCDYPRKMHKPFGFNQGKWFPSHVTDGCESALISLAAHKGFEEAKQAITKFLCVIDDQERRKFISELNQGFSSAQEPPSLIEREKVEQYVRSTKTLVEDYKDGADSGDWGFWEFEEEPEVIAYREAEKNLDSILNPNNS